MDAAPLILTLSLDGRSQQTFDALREKYFPPERNFLRAHCTLFHALPGVEEEAIRNALDACSKEYPAFELTVGRPKSIGRGVAFPLDGDAVTEIHQRLQRRWWDWLTAQDRQRLWPHITVQNKVSPEEARTTLAALSATYESRIVTAVGLQLWRYLNGPWAPVAASPFTDTAATSF